MSSAAGAGKRRSSGSSLVRGGGIEKSLKKFAELVCEASTIAEKFVKLEEICETLKICRGKLHVLKSDEASTVLADIEPDYQQKLSSNVADIFTEQVENGKLILEEIDATISELQTLFDTIRNKFEEGKGVISLSGAAALSYEDCRSILTFLKLKTNIFKSHLSIPVEESVSFDPSLSFRTDEENFTYLLAKLNTAAASF